MVFIYLFLAALGLCCFVQAFSSGEWELLFISVLGLLVAVASLVAERGPWVLGLQLLRLSGSVVVAHGLMSYSTACGIFPDQGSNLCPLP